LWLEEREGRREGGREMVYVYAYVYVKRKAHTEL
jgi:hypothetical protein